MKISDSAINLEKFEKKLEISHLRINAKSLNFLVNSAKKDLIPSELEITSHDMKLNSLNQFLQ